MMEIEFTLHLTIKGSSLDQIDEGLCKAAGERLIARMKAGPALNVNTKAPPDPPLNQKVAAQAQAKVEEHRLNAAPKKERSAAQKANDALLGQRRAAAAGRAAPVAQKTEPPAHVEPAVRALRIVHAKLGDAGVDKLLSKFSISKTRELLPDQVEAFVQFANSMLEVPNGNEQN